MEDKNQTAETTEIDRTGQEHPNAHETVTTTVIASDMTVVADDGMIEEIGTAVEVMDGETTHGEATEGDMVSGIWTGMVTEDSTEMTVVPEMVIEVNATEGEMEKTMGNAVVEVLVGNAPEKESQLHMLRTQIWPV